MNPTLHQQLLDPACPAKLLAENAQKHPMLVARNPNTPANILAELIEHAKLSSVVQSALDNPALALLSLEEPKRYVALMAEGRANVYRKRLYMLGRQLREPENEYQRLALCFAQHVMHHFPRGPQFDLLSRASEHPTVMETYRILHEYLSTPHTTSPNLDKTLCQAWEALGTIRLAKPKLPTEDFTQEDHHVYEREKRAHSAAYQARNALRYVLRTKHGKQFMWEDLRCAAEAARIVAQAAAPLDEAKAAYLNEYQWQVEYAERGAYCPRLGAPPWQGRLL